MNDFLWVILLRCQQFEYAASNGRMTDERRWRRYIPPKRRLTFDGLLGITHQETDLIVVKTIHIKYAMGKARRRDTSFGMSKGYGVDYLGSIPGGARFFSPPRRPHRLWDPPSIKSNGYRLLFP
jgi:hypothetical protein